MLSFFNSKKILIILSAVLVIGILTYTYQNRMNLEKYRYSDYNNTNVSERDVNIALKEFQNKGIKFIFKDENGNEIDSPDTIFHDAIYTSKIVFNEDEEVSTIIFGRINNKK